MVLFVWASSDPRLVSCLSEPQHRLCMEQGGLRILLRGFEFWQTHL